MWGTCLAVVVTSVMGSTHCVGMCGPFVLLAGKQHCKQYARLLILYHLGRFCSYALLGALAGLLGFGILGLGELTGISGEIIQYSGLVLVLYGIWLIWSQLFHEQINLWWVPQQWQNIVQAGYRSTKNYPQHLKSLLIGFYSGFLPCGWLYAFIMLAIGSHSIIHGAGILVSFWLGTIPALTGFSWGIAHLGNWFKSRTQIMSAGICIIFGMMMLVGERPACCQHKQVALPWEKASMQQDSPATLIPQQISRPCCQP